MTSNCVSNHSMITGSKHDLTGVKSAWERTWWGQIIMQKIPSQRVTSKVDFSDVGSFAFILWLFTREDFHWGDISRQFSVGIRFLTLQMWSLNRKVVYVFTIFCLFGLFVRLRINITDTFRFASPLCGPSLHFYDLVQSGIIIVSQVHCH